LRATKTATYTVVLVYLSNRTARLHDAARHPPALLTPVIFIPVRALVPTAGAGGLGWPRCTHTGLDTAPSFVVTSETPRNGPEQYVYFGSPSLLPPSPAPITSS